VRIRRITSHSLQAIAEAALIAMLVVGLMAGTAFAGKPATGTGGHGKPGSGGSTGTLTLVMVADTNGNGAANWGDTITFSVTSSSATPTVSVRCSQNGTLVYAADAGFYPSYPWPGAQNMPLYSPSWTGGAASCTTTLNGSPALSFNVAA
jgi:hypothetical protein